MTEIPVFLASLIRSLVREFRITSRVRKGRILLLNRQQFCEYVFEKEENNPGVERGAEAGQNRSVTVQTNFAKLSTGELCKSVHKG